MSGMFKLITIRDRLFHSRLEKRGGAAFFSPELDDVAKFCRKMDMKDVEIQ